MLCGTGGAPRAAGPLTGTCATGGGSVAEAERAASEGEGARAGLFPSRYLGLGLLLAWNWCVHTRSAITAADVPAAADAIPSAAVSVGPDVACTAVLLAAALLCDRFDALSTRRAPAAVGTGCAVCATALRVAIANGALPAQGFGLAYAALAGVGTAVLMLCWADLYSRMAARSVFFYGAACLATSAAATALVGWLVQPVRLAAVVALPLASGVLLRLSSAYLAPAAAANAGGRAAEGGAGAGAPAGPAAGTARPGKRLRYRFPWKPVVVMAVAGFMGELVGIALFTQGAAPHVAAQGIVGAAVLAAMLVPGLKASPDALMPLSLCCLAASMAVLALAGGAGARAAALLAMAGVVLASLFTLALLAEVGRERGVPSAWLFGLALAARQLATGAGAFSNLALPGISEAADDRLRLAAIAVVGLLCVGAIGAVWLSERSFRGGWTLGAVDAETGERVVSEEEAFLGRCAALAREGGLSEREAEVMAMLARKLPYQDIAQDLVLSLNTVKSHAHHVYAKLGVRNRDELAALIERANPAGRAG